MISIVINNYNYARFLPEAIESALSQDGDKEVLVVDDGSTDNSEQVLARYEKQGVIVVRKKNGGQASAMNEGYRRSSGDWIYFLDADDLLNPGALTEVRKVLRPGLAKVHFPLQILRDGEGLSGEVHSRGLSHGDVAREIAETGHHSWPPTSGNVFARRTLEQILPIPEGEFRISADHYLNTRAPFYGEIVAIDQPLARYRIHGKNLYYRDLASAKSEIENAGYQSKAIEAMSQLLERQNIPYDPEVFLRRASVSAMIVHWRFTETPATGRTKSRNLLKRYFRSAGYRSGSWSQRLRWRLLLQTLASAPLPAVKRALTLREQIWRVRVATGIR